MGVRILATAVHSAPCEDSIDHVTTAAAACLERAGAARSEVDLLVFVGTTKLDYIGEPSTASLIQQRLRLNPSYEDLRAGRSTLSFDLCNTACGFLVACQTFDALARARGVRRALVVSSDLHPSRRPGADHPFAPTSAAAWIETDEHGGFQAFTFRTAPEQGPGLRVFTDIYGATPEHGTRSYYVFDADYVDKAQAVLLETVREHLAVRPEWPGSGRAARLVCVEPAAGFAAKIAHAVGLSPDAPVDVRTPLGPTHTTASIVGFHALNQTGAVMGPVLFAACGAGLTAMVGSYDG